MIIGAYKILNNNVSIKFAVAMIVIIRMYVCMYLLCNIKIDEDDLDYWPDMST